MVTGPIICPRGNQYDRIQKVSSVHAENTASSAYGRILTGTVLAEKLAPPVEPKAPPCH